MAEPGPSDGMEARAKGGKLRAAAYALLFVALAGATAALAFLGNPLAGNPITNVSLPARPVAQNQVAAPAAGTPAITAETELPPPIKPGPITSAIFAGRALVADPRSEQ